MLRSSAGVLRSVCLSNPQQLPSINLILDQSQCGHPPQTSLQDLTYPSEVSTPRVKHTQDFTEHLIMDSLARLKHQKLVVLFLRERGREGGMVERAGRRKK